MRKPKGAQSTIASKYLITSEHHHLNTADIGSHAINVLKRLNDAGYEAYLVGGSVRDLLLRKAPKDFDVATNATPSQIKRLFRNARIIGRRFKLVHIIFHREIIEVATFRGNQANDSDQFISDQGMLLRDNVFGSLEDDAWRRDFTINSLYYNLENGSIVDYTGGVEDIEKRTIRIIGDPTIRYQEDPVRMLRAIRFSAKLNFLIEEQTAKPIHHLNALIRQVASSRLFDEMVKLYQCGHAQTVQQLLQKYGLFAALFPQTHALWESHYPLASLINFALESTDKRIQDSKPVTPAFLFATLLWFPMLARAQEFQQSGLEPLPSIEKAMSVVIYEQNQIVSIPKRFSIAVREIWIMQYRLTKRAGKRAFQLLHHPRFRAAYDFLALRALAGDESMELANWWTEFQEVDETIQQQMVACLKTPAARKKRRPKPRAAS